jgi:segregation and condensation protein B
MLKSIIESLLFIIDRPLSLKELARFTKSDIEAVRSSVDELINEYNSRNGGIIIIKSGDEIQMVTNPKNYEWVKNFSHEEFSGELTPASLETLSVIAYRGPISREEIEQIRGVNCAVILRHLMIRGMIFEEMGENKKPLYRLSLDFIRQLGINDLSELPDYQRLHNLSLSNQEKEM